MSTRVELSQNITHLALHGYLNQGELCETLDLEGCDLPELPAFSFSATSYDAMLGHKGAKQW